MRTFGIALILLLIGGAALAARGGGPGPRGGLPRPNPALMAGGAVPAPPPAAGRARPPEAPSSVPCQRVATSVAGRSEPNVTMAKNADAMREPLRRTVR